MNNKMNTSKEGTGFAFILITCLTFCLMGIIYIHSFEWAVIYGISLLMGTLMSIRYNQ